MTAIRHSRFNGAVEFALGGRLIAGIELLPLQLAVGLTFIDGFSIHLGPLILYVRPDVPYVVR